MDVNQREHPVATKGELETVVEVDKFLSIIEEPSEWTKKYDALDDLQKKDLYFGILRKIEESVQKHDIDRFENLCKIMCRLHEAEKNEEQVKHTHFEIFKYVSNGKMKIQFTIVTPIERGDSIYDILFKPNEAGHTRYYYAIRSNNVDELETLIKSVNHEPKVFYDLLSNDYESLKLKNVCIHEFMEIFVEERLVRERFLRDIADARDATISTSKKKPNTSRPQNLIYEKLHLIITATKELNKITSFIEGQNSRISIALLIAKNIRMLKGQLKSTYSQLPWEEMEFYLARYAFLHSVERTKLQHYLDKFVDKLKIVFGINNESDDNKSAVYEEINKYVNSTVPADRKKINEFETFYDDYELMKDEYSLDKIMRYIQLALSANPEELSGRLIIQRALHVIGEFVKNSPASPNLSESAQQTFYCNAMGLCIEFAPSLRDTLSHIEELHILLLRESIENQIEFFKKLHRDLERAIGVVVHVSCYVKAKHFKRWCQTIMDKDDAEEFEEQCLSFVDYLRRNKLPEVEAPELDVLKEVENLLAELEMIFTENSVELTVGNIEDSIAAVKNIIGLEKKDMVNKINKFNSTFQATEKAVSDHLYRIGELDKRDDDTLDKMTVKESSKTFFKYVFYNIKFPMFSGGLKRITEISKFLDRIQESAEGTSKYGKILKLIRNINRLLLMKSYYLKFVTLEEFKEKLDLSEAGLSDPAENIEIELDRDFEAFRTVLGSEEALLEVQSSLEKPKTIHQIKLKVNGCYKENKHRLTSHELEVVNKELGTKKSEGKHLLGKTMDFYGEFLTGKREFHKFAGALRLKSKEDTAKLIAIFSAIKLEPDHDPELLLNKTIRQFREESTIERYNDMASKLEIVKQDHKARLKLASFFDNFIELERNEYKELVASLNITSKAKMEFEKLYNFSNTAYVAESLSDPYGTLLNVVKNKNSSTDKICNAYVNFLDTLQLPSGVKKLLKETIIQTKILTILDEQFSTRLNLLKEVLGNVKTRDSKCLFISRYRADKKLQAIVEMLLFDLCNMSTEATLLCSKFMPKTSRISLNFLENGFLYLNGNFSFLKGNSLRNYLAHGDALIDALPFDASIAVVSCAILFCEEAESLIALRNITNNDNMVKNLVDHMKNSPDELLSENFPSDAQFNLDHLKSFQKSQYWIQYFETMFKNPVLDDNIYSHHDQLLDQCISQVTLFTAVSEGDKQKFESLLASGEEVHSRNFYMRSLLHVAANQGHNDIVEILLNNGITVDTKDRSERTSLYCASHSGHCLVVETLLKRGANVYAVDMFGTTALHAAAVMGHSEVAGILLKFGADCNACNNTGSTPLHCAAWRGNLKTIKLFVEFFKANVDVEDHSGNGPLHMAAKGLHNNTQVFEYFITRDPASINSENKSSITPLQIALMYGNGNGVETMLRMGGTSVIKNHKKLLLTAAIHGNVKIFRFLREHGVDVNDVTSGECSTALHLAARNGHNQLVQYLIQKKYSVDTKTDIGITPLHLAVQSGDYETVKVLVENGKSDPNIRDHHGTTPLNVAILFNHLSIVKYLVGRNADLNVLDYEGMSLLHRWASNGNSDVKIADYLINDLQLISMLDVRDKIGGTPLRCAASIGTMSAIEYLVEKGARLDVRDDNGATLLHAAVDRGNLQLVKYFLEKMGDKMDGIVHATDHKGNNVLNAAVMLGHTNIVDILLETRNDTAFVNSYNNYHYSPLFHAVLGSKTNIVKNLLKNGACCDGWQNPEGSPLSLAAGFSSKKILKILLDNGANPNRSTGHSPTPLLHAVSRGEQDIVTLLLDAGANINFALNDGTTAIHIAAKLRHYKIAELLVARGADIEAVDENGSTPMHHAIANDDTRMNFILVMTGFFNAFDTVFNS